MLKNVTRSRLIQVWFAVVVLIIVVFLLHGPGRQVAEDNMIGLDALEDGFEDGAQDFVLELYDVAGVERRQAG